ncbi:MAG: tetraacyldisaccharide 4'-kinase [Gemmatimonadetes bacterium]|nr:MAG: tetraacyldisaccharide 4'-kinase [Gemmatimonadota bacterium]
MTALEQVWYGESAGARIGRAALWPAEQVYAAAVRLRGALYDRALLETLSAPLPVLAIGNLSVGGTGKTPIAAWAVSRLRDRGAHPAVVLRGYGGDEPLVHEILNPGTPVLCDSDRVRGARTARSAGADCVVLDDAFQHRRIARTADWVLISAERFTSTTHMLPAGPLREPLAALARADVAIVTRKVASTTEAQRVAERIESMIHVGTAVVHLAPSHFVDAHDETSRPLDAVRGARVVAVAAVGEPEAFFAQLRELGARDVQGIAYRDHHAFTAADVARLARAAAQADAVVCTLKDAVKLAPQWTPRAVPLWYVSQRAEVEHGAHLLDASLAHVLAARTSTPSTAGATG